MFAVLHLADFPLHAVLRTERGAASKPAALFSSTSKKSVVLAANPAARSHGVELGMTAPQAMARCPALLIRSPHPDAEAEERHDGVRREVPQDLEAVSGASHDRDFLRQLRGHLQRPGARDDAL